MTSFAGPAHLQTLLETLQDVVFQTDAGGRFTFLNRAWSRLTGFDVEQTLGRSFLDFVWPEDRDHDAERFRAIVEERIDGTRHEVRCLTADGSFRTVEVHGRRLRSRDGTVTGVVGTLTDVEDRRRAEQHLRLQHAVAGILAESAGVEDAAPRLLAAIGESMAWSLGELWLVDAAEERLRLAAFWRRRPGTGREFERLARTTTFRRGFGLPGTAWAEGRAVWVPDVLRWQALFAREQAAAAEGLHGAVGLPVLDRDGAPVAVACFFAGEVRRPDPATEESLSVVAGQVGQFLRRTLAEAELHRQLSRSAAIVESSGDGIVAVDAGGHITSWNRGAERIFACPRERVRGRPVVSLFAGEDGERVRALLEDVRRGGRALTADAVGTHADGHPLQLALTVSPVVDVAGRVEAVSLVLRDVTERRRMEEELRRSNADLSHFAAAISHDLVEPLRTISGFAELVSRRYADRLDERGQEMLHHVVDGAVRLDRMVEGLRQYATAARDLRIEEVDTGDVVRRTVQALAARIEAEGAEVEIGQLPRVRADPSAVERIVQNLLHNALKFTRDGLPARVSVHGSVEDGWAHLCVRDRGVGIPDGRADEVYAMFRSAHPGSDAEGTGVGVPMCQKLAERHGGRLWFESVPGEGTTFVVALPSAG